DLRLRQPEVRGPYHFALAHGNAARDLREILTKADTNEKFLGLSKSPVVGHACGIRGKLTNGFDISGEPGEAMRSTLLAIEQTTDDVAFHHHPLAYLRRRISEQRIESRTCLLGKIDQIFFCGKTGRNDWHRILWAGLAGVEDTTRAVHKSKASRKSGPYGLGAMLIA